MRRKGTLHLFFSILVCQLLSAMFWLPVAVAQNGAEPENSTSPWGQLFSGTLPKTIAALFIFASINYTIKLFRKDKILKKLLKKYVVFEMKDGNRYRGTMRLEINGLEIISEESRQRGLAPSYILREDKDGDVGIVAYIRYFDVMNEREKLERDWDFERVYHPRLPTRIRRKIRNFGIALRDSVNETIKMVWGQIKKTAVFRPVAQYQKDIDTAQQQLVEYAMEESYERLIERLVGTRIKVSASTGEYFGVLKEYNDKHIYLMDVKQSNGLGYKDEWNLEPPLDIEHNKVNVRDDRGLRCKIEGRHLIFENNAPYEIQLRELKYVRDKEEDKHEYWRLNYRIAPFSVQKIFLEPRPKNHNVGPFERVVTQEQRTHKYFKQIQLTLRSFREADIVFPRRYCRVVESAEKYQPELLNLGSLTEVIIDAKKAKDITIADKEGKPIHGMNLISGYITNINEDRIDVKTINHKYGRRWSVEHAFHRFDDKFRKIGPIPVKVLPAYRERMAAQAVLVNGIGKNQPEQKVFSPYVYTPVTPRVKGYKKLELPVKVLALMGNTTEEEFPVLTQFEELEAHHIIYEQVRDLRTDNIARTHLLWLGHGEVYKDGYRLNIDAEHRIKSFASKGGIVIVSGQDISNISRRRQSVGWVPEPLIGVEHEETLEFAPTHEGKKRGIFQSPHKIQSGQIKLDDMWIDRLHRYTVLAKANGGDEAAILLLRFQKGLYIITSLKNETASDVQINQNIMENLLHFSVRWLEREQKHTHLYYTNT